MAFDKSLDKELFSESVDFERSVITVAVFSYNEGTPKLGRMTKEEVLAVLPLMEKAKEYL